MAPLERWGLARQRHLTLMPARGLVLDVRARHGANLAHFPSGVSVIAVEPDAAFLVVLGERAAGVPAGVDVEVVGASVPGLPFADGAFDTVVCTMALCTVEDLGGAVADLRRVLAGDGELLFFEHTVGRRPMMAAVQRAVAPVWVAAGGCHVDRDVIAALRAGGFVVGDCERLSPVGRLSAGTFVRGRAIKRSGG